MSLFRLAFFPAWLICSILMASLSMALPALAASSPWAENEGGRMRLVLLGPNPDGTRDGALVIEPKAGWVTYWKEPGDVGIPPSLTAPPGAPYAVERLEFPVPKQLDAGGMRDIGYDHPVALPLTLSGTAESQPVTLSAFIGVCDNICIPFQADLVATPASTPSAEEQQLVEKARGQLPEQPSAAFGVTSYAMQPDHKQLDVTLTVPEGLTPSAFFLRGPSGFVFVHGRFTPQAGQSVTLSVPIHKLPKSYRLAGKRWELLVIAGNRAMEAPLAFD